MKIQTNSINLNAVRYVESIEDKVAEKCQGGAFVADFGDYGRTRTTAPFLVDEDNTELYVGAPLEQLTLRSVDDNEESNSFNIEWLDANSNVMSTQSVTSFETAVIPGATFARIAQG